MTLRPRLLALTLMVAAAAAARLLPHAPNFTPIAALALFGGAKFDDKRLAFAVPAAAMLLSDLVLGFHASLPAVYLAFALVVGLGLLLRGRERLISISAAVLTGSAAFFIITNLAVWAIGSMYPKTTAGLVDCYVAALPFFRNELAGDGAYALLLFGGFALLERRFTPLRRAPVFAF
jgi:hypothetical protein